MERDATQELTHEQQPSSSSGGGAYGPGWPTMTQVVRATVTALLWLLLACCILCFTVVTFMRPTNFWLTDQTFLSVRDHMIIFRPESAAAITVLHNTMETGQAFPVTLQVGSVMIAALAVAGLKYLAFTHPAPLATPCTGGVLASCCGCFGSLSRKVRCVLSYPLPPTRFWNWFCGGMSVMDALFLSIWTTLCVIYILFQVNRSFQSIAESLGGTQPPPDPDLPATTTQDFITPAFISQRFEICALIFGQVTRFQMMLMFIPISRSHFLKWICGTDFPTLIKYHRWMSWFTIYTILTHSVMYMMLWGAEGTLDTPRSKRMIVGLIATLSSIVIAFTSTAWFRHNYFWLFYKVHVGGFVVFTLFAFMHYKGFVNWILPGLLLHLVDRAFRYYQLATNITTITADDFDVDSNILTLRLRMSKTSSIAPGQTLYLRCPSISLFQLHPFSVADIITDNDSNCTHVIIHLTVKGPWTTALRGRLLEGQTVKVQVEGPYETSLDSLPKTPVVVMVAGGIGATPLLNLLRQYQRQHEDVCKFTPTVHLLWTSRHLASLKLLGQDLLSELHTSAPSTQHASRRESFASSSKGPFAHKQLALALAMEAGLVMTDSARMSEEGAIVPPPGHTMRKPRHQRLLALEVQDSCRSFREQSSGSHGEGARSGRWSGRSSSTPGGSARIAQQDRHTVSAMQVFVNPLALETAASAADMHSLNYELLYATSSCHISPAGSLPKPLRDMSMPCGPTSEPASAAAPQPHDVSPTSAPQPHDANHAASPSRQSAEAGQAETKGWLSAQVYYTGAETPSAQHTPKTLVMPAPKRVNSSDTLSITTQDPTTPVRPLSLQPTHCPALYAVCILLGFFGGWAGLLAAQLFENRQPNNYLLIGAVEWFCIGLGALLPACLALAIYGGLQGLWTREAEQGVSDEESGSADTSVTLQSSVTVLPGYILAPVDAAAGSQHHGTRLPLVRGRPDVMALLQQVKREYDHLSSVEVLVGGGDELCQATEAACATCNTTWGDKGPTLVCRRIAHHH